LIFYVNVFSKYGCIKLHLFIADFELLFASLKTLKTLFEVAVQFVRSTRVSHNEEGRANMQCMFEPDCVEAKQKKRV
jgi:hypothetical protein